MNGPLNDLLTLLSNIGSTLLDAMIAGEAWLRAQLALLGLPAPIQTGVIFGLIVLLLFTFARLLDGLIRIAVILVLIGIAIQLALPYAYR